jgi:hypothetical protein
MVLPMRCPDGTMKAIRLLPNRITECTSVPFAFALGKLQRS